MLILEESRYLNSIFQLNYARYGKCYDIKLFTTKRSTNLKCKIESFSTGCIFYVLILKTIFKIKNSIF